MKHRVVSWSIIILLTFLYSGHAYSEESSPGLLALKGTIERVREILSDESLKRPDRAQERLSLLHAEYVKRFDYKKIVRGIFGIGWGALSGGQQDQFVALFSKYFSYHNSKDLEFKDVETIQYETTNSFKQSDYEAEEVKVTTRAKVTGAAGVDRVFRLYKGREGQWQVQNVIVNNIGLFYGSNPYSYHSQFAKVIKTSSVEELLRRLQKFVWQAEGKEGDVLPES